MKASHLQGVVVLVLQVADCASEFLSRRGSAFSQPRGKFVDTWISVFRELKRFLQFLTRSLADLNAIALVAVEDAVDFYSGDG